MPTRRTPPAAAPPDLRHRILQTSRELLETAGVAGLSLREVARRAGVTHQAPYHHFADREAILAELVMQGFDDLALRLARANDSAEARGRHAALMASCEAYVGFALDQPGVFRIMFRPDVCDAARFPAVQASGARARAELDRLVRLMHAGRHTEVLASTYWAHVHGLACLFVDGPLGQALPARKARLAHLRDVSAQFADFVLGTAGQSLTGPRGKATSPESRMSKGE